MSHELSTKKAMKTLQNNNPWAGLASYEDPNSTRVPLKFYGRDNESYDVAKLISTNIFVTLYGKSGIGKTSLLNAGVFPELRLDKFMPVNIRLGIKNEAGKAISFQSKIITLIENLVEKTENIDVIEPQYNELSPDYLWNYFARHRFFNKEKEVYPVMVFDQFEELFGTYREEVEILLRQLDYINDRDHTLDNCVIDGKKYHYTTNYRFVVSIREDDLYKLEDSLDICFLPALKKCRYRLHGLSPKGAKDVILLPCKEINIFDKENEKVIADRIIDISNGSDRYINTLMLSLLCYILYNDSLSQNRTIQPSDLDRFKDILKIYYLDLIGRIPDRQRKYIEDNLVDEQGRRRTIYLTDLTSNAPEALRFTQSSNTRLLNVNEGRVELIHDQLAATIQSCRIQRYEIQRTHSIVASLFTYYVIVAFFIWHILLKITHAYWAYMPSNSALKYVFDSTGITSVDMSMQNVTYLIFSQICSNLVLIYLISFEVPRKICEYFYNTLNMGRLLYILTDVIILSLLGSNWLLGLSLSLNSMIFSLIGWVTLFTILILKQYKK